VNRVFFPLDAQLGIHEIHWSEAVARQAVWLYGHVEDDLAEQILNQIGGIAISDTSVWRRAQKWGEQMRLAEKARATAAVGLPQKGALIRGTVPHDRPMGVGMDGGMVNIRDEGWKEIKVGTVFEIEQRTAPDPVTQEAVAQAHAVQNSYVAVFGGPTALGRVLWAEAVRREFPEAGDSIVVSDAAAWIWNVTGEHFSTSRQLVDWFHAKEHLYTAGKALYGEGTPQTQKWVKRMETPLYQGHAAEMAIQLKALAKTHRRTAKVLRGEAGYFERQQRRMQYLETREDGFPIGSGMVESGIKQFHARLTGPGMRWSHEGMDRILPIRAAILSKRFDQLWETVYHLPPN
jgi:hypothetical protein